MTQHKVHFGILNCGLARESFSTDNPYKVTCARCLRELDKMRAGKLPDKSLELINYPPSPGYEMSELPESIRTPEACLERGKRLNHLIENNNNLQLAGIILNLEDQLQKAKERKELWHLIAGAFQDDNWKPVFEHLQTMHFD